MSIDSHLPATALPPALTRRERRQLEDYLGQAAHQRRVLNGLALVSFTVTLTVMLGLLSMPGLHTAAPTLPSIETALAVLVQR